MSDRRIENVAAWPPPRLGYLSAAPTVSTRADAASAGPRAHILGVIAGFRARGWQVEPFIVGDETSEPGERTARHGTETTLAGRLVRSVTQRLGDGSVQRHLERMPLLRPLADLARLLLAARNRRRAWRQLGGRVDWVYERFATMAVLGSRFKRAGVPWILETQGLFYYETRTERATVGLSWLAERIEKAAYRACDVLIVVSPALRELVVAECGIDPAKILVVPNAVELERFHPVISTGARPLAGEYAARRGGVPSGAPPSPADGEPTRDLTLGFVGGLIGWQALDRLMEAMARLEESEGLVTRLVVIGDGVMRAPWQARAVELGLADRVLFKGAVAGDRVAAEMAAFDIGYAGARVMRIGRMYHSPIKLYEYMAMAKPVLAAAYDDARELVAHPRTGASGTGDMKGADGSTGFLFTPDDQDDLVRALRRVHAERAALPAMGARARVLIEAEHSWNVRAAAMIDQLELRLGRRTAHDTKSAEPEEPSLGRGASRQSAQERHASTGPIGEAGPASELVSS
ncbi:MAG: glycosyltransferase family 4 protein [Geminicoccaceae bacterium]|nr:glycosyltransferase family 4 protein [Geminicoccaceae bacterium]